MLRRIFPINKFLAWAFWQFFVTTATTIESVGLVGVDTWRTKIPQLAQYVNEAVSRTFIFIFRVLKVICRSHNVMNSICQWNCVWDFLSSGSHKLWPTTPTTKQNLVILSSKVAAFYLPRVKPVDFILIVLPCLCPLLQPIKKPVSVSLCTATIFSKALIMFNECNQMATIVLNIAPFIIIMLHL